MAFERDTDQNHQEIHQQGNAKPLFDMAFQIIKYPIEHPFKAMLYLLWLNMARELFNRVYNTYYNDETIKYPLEALHTAYRVQASFMFPILHLIQHKIL